MRYHAPAARCTLETKRWLDARIKEHKGACVKCLPISYSRACMDERPPNKFGRDEGFTKGKQDGGAGSEGIAEHTYDTRGHTLQRV